MDVRHGGAAFATALLAGSAAFGHHSPAAYDQAAEILIDGTIAEVDWRNPHVYLTVETVGADGAPALQEIEGNSVSSLRSIGVSREQLVIGAPVVVRAFANRRGEGRTALGADVTFEDGSVLPLSASGRGTTAPTATTPAQSIAGHWTPPQNPRLIPTVMGWPITPAGRAAQAASLGGPGAVTISIGCASLQPPMLTMLPPLRIIEIGENEATMTVDADGAVLVRTVHLDQAEHPADLAPSPLGHSIGRWEGETLIIDSIGFEPHITGIGFGVPSGLGKHLVERLTLTEDRLGLQYELTVEDPEYLSAPATYTAVWAHRPELESSGEACDPENAERYLEE